MSSDPSIPPTGNVPPTPPPIPPAQPGFVSGSMGSMPIPPEEVQLGKTFAVLSYVLNILGLPFWAIPLFFARDNNFSLYHAKQSAVIWIVMIAGAIVSIPLMFICVGYFTWFAVWVGCLILNIMGLVNANAGTTKPVPALGSWGESWFKGFTKQAPPGVPGR
jgi:uncharacterized membrane protein